MTYDEWKASDPADARYCQCGLFSGDCVKGDAKMCPVEVLKSMDEATPEEIEELQQLGLLP